MPTRCVVGVVIGVLALWPMTSHAGDWSVTPSNIVCVNAVGTSLPCAAIPAKGTKTVTATVRDESDATILTDAVLTFPGTTSDEAILYSFKHKAHMAKYPPSVIPSLSVGTTIKMK